MGVTYYKLENGYPGDVTKGCGLAGSEIDKNFHFLRGYDIKDASVNAAAGTIVLERVNGDEVVISGVDKYFESIIGDNNVKINEEDSYYDSDRYELHISLDYGVGEPEDFVISGFRIEADRIYVGEGLAGDGSINNPLRLNGTYKTGFFQSVKEFIDFVMSTKRGICPGRLLHKED